tara:strand:+ start:2421 stop:2687 length:267 start_codon:yes stop_codon:yes gene_type:complete
MPVSSAVVVVGTGATALMEPQINPKVVYVQDGDYDNSSFVYVGGPDVTVNTGIRISKFNVSVFQVNADDILYGISDAATGAVRITEVF